MPRCLIRLFAPQQFEITRQSSSLKAYIAPYDQGRNPGQRLGETVSVGKFSHNSADARE